VGNLVEGLPLDLLNRLSLPCGCPKKYPMKYLLTNSFLQVKLDEGRSMLFLDWTADTEQMTNEDYRAVLTTLAGFVENYAIKKWLGNTLHFSFPISPNQQEWTVAHFDNRLVAAGLVKMALIIPAKYIANLAVHQTVEEMEMSNTHQHFAIQYFDQVTEAERWLMEA
jgi:hypothetical protein